MKIVLASASPRRSELLRMLGVRELEICPARGEEKKEAGLSPAELVMSLSRAKAEEVSAQYPADTVIIAADTIVWINGRVLGKPKSREEAAEMLHTLSGSWHEVYTGVALLSGGKTALEYEMSRVHFRPLTEGEIAAYIRDGEPMDKAGAYGAQGKGALFVDRIEGDFFNVMGLPVCRLGQMLKERGVELL